MDRDTFVDLMNHQLKLVRTEYGLTQEAMARALGLSKKTLVEIEKGRSSLGWMGRRRPVFHFLRQSGTGRIAGR